MEAKIFKIAFTSSLLYFALFAIYVPSTLNAQSPTVSFVSADGGSVQEGIGNTVGSVIIMNANSNETTVQISHSGSATYGVDYTITPETIVFAAGSAASQPLTYHLLDDCDDEAIEDIILTLTNPTNGAQIGIGTITTSLLDDDETPVEDCGYTVPNNTFIVQSAMEYLANNGNLWVCGSGELNLQSSNNIVLIESGGIVTTSMDNNDFFVKDGGSVTVNDGEQNRIYAENGAVVMIASGACNAVFAGENTSVSDNGTGTVNGNLTCPQLAIDYTGAPETGCVISAVHDLSIEKQIELYPNPTSGHFDINHPGNSLLQSIEVYDGQGALVKKLNPQERDLKSSPGVYFLRCIYDDGIFTKRLIIANE